VRKSLSITMLSSLAVAMPAGVVAVAQAAEVLPATTTPTTAPAVSTSGGPTAAGVKRKVVAANVRARKFRPKPPPPPAPKPVAVSPALQAIASCESGGDPAAVSADGLPGLDRELVLAAVGAVGGSGDPAAAPEAEQDRLAQVLYETAGPGQWPNCAQ
jgi:hypothetical protein